MELIDRDALHQTYMRWFKKESVNNGTVTKAITLADALMRSEPEVDAIPVEWIEKWNEEKCIKAINWLIEDWRNEQDM